MDEHVQKLEQVRSAQADVQPDPIDCDALLDVIQAAQSLYTEHCAIARTQE